MPACVAVTTQVVVVTPLGRARVVIFRPLTVQTAGVCEVRVGVSPELAVAPDAKVELGALVPGLAKVIVWRRSRLKSRPMKKSAARMCCSA